MADMPGRSEFDPYPCEAQNLQRGDVVVWGDNTYKLFVFRTFVGPLQKWRLLFLDGTTADVPPTYTFGVIGPWPE